MIMPPATDDAPRTEEWRVILTEGHGSMVRARRIFRHLPSEPRCKVCSNPFGGLGGRIVGLAGWKPSRKNPNLCARCCDSLPVGGADVDVAVLFADVRGSTGIGESAGPAAFAGLLNRFYAAATEALLRHDAVIDKLIGDEVMALYLPDIKPGLTREQVPALMLEHARALLRSVGYGSGSAPFVEMGVGIDVGEAFVGNIGQRALYDFTAVGDVVNTASRLQAQAGGGEVVVSERVARGLPGPVGTRTELTLKGKSEPQVAYRVGL
jgi:adenylate cyclase